MAQLLTSIVRRSLSIQPKQGEGAQADGLLSPDPIGGYLKRAIDVAIAFTALLLLAPVLAAVAAAIRLTMGGPVLFAHMRVGHGGRLFPCFKFRTMITNADRVLADHLARHPELAREWQETQKLTNDPRVTPLGRFLRKTSIDELPQLINVLLGHMSCVGPRPIVTAELARYGAGADDYLSARPGLTGLWQVSGRSNTSYDFRVALDRRYVANWSLWTDVSILLKTVVVVFQMRGAV